MLDFKKETKHILSILQKNGPVTKYDLQEQTGFTLTSLNRFFDPLAHTQLAQLCGHKESEGGRPSALFDINTTNFAIIGIDISRTYCRIVLTTLKMNVLYTSSYTILENTKGYQLIEWITDQISQMQARDDLFILGIGIGTVGPIDKETGRFIKPKHFPYPKLIETNFYQELNLKTSLPIVINSGSAAALHYEYLFGNAKAYSNIAYVNCGVSIRDSVFIKGHSLSDDLASEDKLAHMVINYDGRPCSCGNRGCVDTYSSLHGISAYLNQTISSSSTAASYHDLLSQCTKNDTAAYKALQSGAKALGLGLSNYIRLFNLDYIILNGPLAINFEHYYTLAVDTALEHIKDTSYQSVQFNKGGSNSQLSMAIGAACHFFESFILS